MSFLEAAVGSLVLIQLLGFPFFRLAATLEQNPWTGAIFVVPLTLPPSAISGDPDEHSTTPLSASAVCFSPCATSSTLVDEI